MRNQYKFLFIKSGIVVSFLLLLVQADEPSLKYVYTRPLYKTDSFWEQKASKVLYVEIQNHLMNNNNLSWDRLDYHLDTALHSWYQTKTSDTIRSVPERIISGLDGKRLVLIYNLSGFSADIGKDPPLALLPGGRIGVREERNLAGELNDYENIFFLSSVFDSRGKLVASYQAKTTGVDDAVRTILDLPEVIKLPPKKKRIIQHEDTLNAVAKYKLGKGLFMTGNILTFLGFGIVVSGNSDDALTLGVTLLTMGQTGLLLCGYSNYLMKTAFTNATGVGFALSKYGYICHGAGLTLLAGGAITGIVSDNTVSVLGAGTSMLLGYSLTTFAWYPYFKDHKRLDKQFKNFKLLPVASFSKDGFGAGLCVSF